MRALKEDLVYLVRRYEGPRYGFLHGDGPWSVTFNDLALEVVYRQLGLCITKGQPYPLSSKRTEINRHGRRVPLKTTKFVLSLIEDQLRELPEGHMRVNNLEDDRFIGDMGIPNDLHIFRSTTWIMDQYEKPGGRILPTHLREIRGAMNLIKEKEINITTSVQNKYEEWSAGNHWPAIAAYMSLSELDRDDLLAMPQHTFGFRVGDSSDESGLSMGCGMCERDEDGANPCQELAVHALVHTETNIGAKIVIVVVVLVEMVLRIYPWALRGLLNKCGGIQLLVPRLTIREVILLTSAR